MKIIFILSQLPYPPDTGAKIRSFNLIKSLSDKHDIALITFGDSIAEEIRKYCKNVYLISKMQSYVYIQALANIFSRYPYSVNKYYSRNMLARIKELLDNEKFNLIHCDSVQVSKNVLKLTSVPKVLTEHNIESQILYRAALAERNILKKLYLYYQYLKLRRYEISACKQFDRVVTVSEEDKRFLVRFIDEDKISVVPNGVDTEYFKLTTPNSLLPTEQSIVFTGSMDWLPNIDAVKYFCKDILPLIWEKKNNLKFYIVGRNAPKDIIALGKNDNRIIVTGSVEDVRPYMEKASVFVVPLRIGGGTRLKILEAMAMEKAVISTSIGCEGLEVIDEKDIIIADGPDKFADKVLMLLDNKEMREEMGKHGRQLVEEKYGWSIISNALDEAWAKAVYAKSIPVLLYHDICEDRCDEKTLDIEKIPYVLDQSVFERQMSYLHDNGCETVGIKVFVCGFAGLRVNNPAISLIFDDGLESNYKIAFPILKKYGLKATFFVTAGQIGRPGMMTWAQIKEMADYGMEIGSHSLTHAIPTTLDEEGLERELKESKRIIEENIGKNIDFFSSPTGFYNTKLPEIAKKCGYKAALISRPALNKVGESFILNKTSIKRGYDFSAFTSIVRRDKYTFDKLLLRQDARDRLKNILGHRIYNIVRRTVLERVK